MEADVKMNTELGNGNTVVRKGGISGSTLKMIAIISMLADHICAVVLTRVAINDLAQSGNTGLMALGQSWLFLIVSIIRLTVGRLAFPIFCFLLVEGFQKTRNVGKYALRLGLFALISEIPFDLALKNKVLEFGYQNVFFTLFIGLLTLIAIKWIEGRSWNKALQIIGMVLALAAGMAAAKLLRTDYDAVGVLLIAALYLFRSKPWQRAVAGSVVLIPGTLVLMGSLSELFATFAFLPIYLYNGERGWKLKYVFYLFYPLHMLILYLICVCMGIQDIPAI